MNSANKGISLLASVKVEPRIRIIHATGIDLRCVALYYGVPYNCCQRVIGGGRVRFYALYIPALHPQLLNECRIFCSVLLELIQREP